MRQHDLLVGAFGDGPNSTESGASYVIFGGSGGFAANVQLSGLTGANGFKLSGVAASDRSGFSVSGAGDINGDGIDDIIVGAYEASPNGTRSGASYVVFGQAPALTIAVGGKSATFTDVDGDRVTVKTTKGTLTPASFTAIQTGVPGGGQLQKLTLDAGFTGAAITITAKPTALGGNGFVNVGFIDATGVDLAAVTLAGDLGRINAGTVAGDAKVPALKTLAVQSIGLLGTSTQAAGGALFSDIKGALGKLTVTGDLRDAALTATSFGAVTIKGSLVGGEIRSATDIKALAVTCDIVGTPADPVIISAFGKATAPAKGADLALGKLSVGGRVESVRILAGFDVFGAAANADAAIGAVAVKGDWLASSVLAGIAAGVDTFHGTADDVKLTGVGVRDVATRFSTIASIVIKGQALGSVATGDHFGIVAEVIGKAKVGTRSYAFKAATKESYVGAPGFDWFLREIAG